MQFRMDSWITCCCDSKLHIIIKPGIKRILHVGDVITAINSKVLDGLCATVIAINI